MNIWVLEYLFFMCYKSIWYSMNNYAFYAINERWNAIRKKLDVNYTKKLRAVLDKSWKQHPAKQLLNGHFPPIKETILERPARHAVYYWWGKDEIINDFLPGTPTYGRTSVGWPA